jgi:hypothetical protein
MKLRLCFLIIALLSILIPVSAQQTNNASTLTNSAAPSASSVTTGGTNINYQTNNAYSNENGFGPGVFCRTPTLYLGGNYGGANTNNYDPVQQNIAGNINTNYSVNAGILLPFSSPILAACAQLARTISRDREISSQLSMLRLCQQLAKEGVKVDPKKFPLLKECASE